MNKIISIFIFWLFFWLGGWVFLFNIIPGGLGLIDRRLFLMTGKSGFVFLAGLGMLLAILATLFFYKKLFNQLNLFSFQIDKLNTFFLSVCVLLLAISLFSIFLIRGKNLSILLPYFLVVVFYYSCNAFFQQLINFGLFQEGLSKIVSPTLTILIVSILFGLSHFLAILQGEKFSGVLILSLLGFLLGLIFSWLRLKENSIFPGFLLHFSFYLFWNGPLLFLLTR